MREPRGFDRNTFEIVEGWPYVESLLTDALTTRKGTRVLARHYGGDLPAFNDAPGNQSTILSMLADVAVACDQVRDLETGEEVVRYVTAEDVSASREGQYGLSLVFEYLPDNTLHRIELDGLSEAA